MDIHFSAYMVKYAVMNDLFEDIFKTTKINTLNIFINLDNFFQRLKNSRINQEFQACGMGAGKQFISNVFNLIAHYRQWGVRTGAITKVYAYYTTAKTGFENRLYLPEYRSYFAHKCNLGCSDLFYINQAINTADPYLKLISKYIDGVYIIDSQYIEPACIPLYIYTNVRQADWNIVISHDNYDLQYCVMDRFSYLYPKFKNKSTDYLEEACIIDKGTMWNKLASKEGVLVEHADKYPPNLILLALAIVGDKHRDIPSIKGIRWRVFFKLMDGIIEKFDGDCSFATLSNALINKIIEKKVDPNVLNLNLMAWNIQQSVNNMDESMKNFINLQLVDVPDYASLEQFNVNPQLLANYPLNLKFLTEESSAYTKPIWGSYVKK